MDTGMKIVIGDADSRVRSALRLALEQNDMAVVGDVSNSEDLLERLRVIQPDLVLLDWDLPGRSSTKTLHVLKTRYPRVSVIVLHSEPEVGPSALAAGADGFVYKGDPPECMLEAIAKISGVNAKTGETNV